MINENINPTFLPGSRFLIFSSPDKLLISVGAVLTPIIPDDQNSEKYAVNLFTRVWAGPLKSTGRVQKLLEFLYISDDKRKASKSPKQVQRPSLMINKNLHRHFPQSTSYSTTV